MYLSQHAIALAVAALIATSTHAASIDSIIYTPYPENPRLTLDLDTGVLGSITVTEVGNKSQLRIILRDVEQSRLQELIGYFKPGEGGIEFARALAGLDGRAALEIGFDRLVRINNELVTALANGRTRFELDLAVADEQAAIQAEQAAKAAAATVAPALGSIGFRVVEDRMDVVLEGSSSLEASVVLSASPPSVTLRMNGVPEAMAREAIQQLQGLPAQVRRISAQSLANANGTQLQIDLNGPHDLVDAAGITLDQQGMLTFALVPDLAVAPSARPPKLLDIVVSPSSQGTQLELVGAASATVSTFSLENPPRLVIDLLGWSPDQVKGAVDRFKTNNPVLSKVALTDTRLGSARLVFETETPVAVYGRTTPRPSAGVPGSLVLALGAPRAAAGYLASRGFDLNMRQDLKQLRRPEVVIKPVALPPAAATQVITPTVGRRFRLMEALAQAKERDPRYMAARQDYAVASEALPQAQAGLRPSAFLDYSLSAIDQNIFRSPNPTFPLQGQNYSTRSYALSISQPLYRPANSIRRSQAELSGEQARLNMMAAEQDLTVRVATAYLNVLAATDALELARAEKEAIAKQLELARVRLESGLGTQAQLFDTQARSALTEAREIESQSKLDDAREALKEMIGDAVMDVRGFRRDFLAVEPKPARVDNWIRAALEQNLLLQARGIAVNIADLEIERQSMGYRPTVDLVGTSSRQDAGGSIFGTGQDVGTNDISVRFRIPLYEGGVTNSLVREATARREKAGAEQEQEARRIERLARSAFFGVQSNVATLDALRKNIIAQEAALETKLEGFKVGLQSVVAVVDAYRLFFAARRDYLQARYDYLANRIRLQQSVGSLSDADIEQLATLLD